MDVAGAVGWAMAGPGWEAALALVAQEAQATGTTLERALRVRKHCLRQEGRSTGHPGTALSHRRVGGGSLSCMPGLSAISFRATCLKVTAREGQNQNSKQGPCGTSTMCSALGKEEGKQEV